MMVNYQISVDEKRAKELVAFLKTLDYVKVEKEGPEKKKAVKATLKKEPLADEDFPYFGMCPDWDIDAKTLRNAGMEKRLKGWL